MSNELDKFMAGLVRRNPGEPEFHQAVREVAATIIPFLADRPEYREARVQYGEGKDRVDYIKGANVASFVKLGDAITAYGIM